MNSKIYFVKQNSTTASERLLGERLCLELQLLGCYPTVVTLEDITENPPKKALVYFVKHLPIHAASRLKDNGNTLILNLSDMIATDRLHEIQCPNWIDCVIHPNKLSKAEFSNHFSCARLQPVIYHCWDNTWPNSRQTKFSLGFIGNNSSRNSVLFLSNLHCRIIDSHSDDMFMESEAISCHYSVRREGSLAKLFKPPTKLFVAAACGANIIASRDASFLEILEDYPFYTDSDLNSVFKTIDLARAMFGSAQWFDSISMLKDLRYRYGGDYFVNSMHQLFSDLDR